MCQNMCTYVYTYSMLSESPIAYLINVLSLKINRLLVLVTLVMCACKVKVSFAWVVGNVE